MTEQLILWLTACTVLVFPFVGWIFNTLITNKINEQAKLIEASETARQADKETFFKRLDDIKKEHNEAKEKLETSIKEEYVQKALYEQAMKFYNEHNDEKFKSLMATMMTQFNNVEEKIAEVKKIIDDKFNNHKQGGS